MKFPGFITTAEVAEHRDTDRTSAHRWLQSNLAKHISHIGRFQVVPIDIYRRASLAGRIDDKFAKVEERLDGVEIGIAELTRRFDAHLRSVATANYR